MKKFTLLLVITLLSCSRDNLKEILDGSSNGTVQLSINLGNFFIGGTGTESPWTHNYQETVDLTFSSTSSSYTKTVSFNPNDLSTFPDTSLPYDTYSWSILNTGTDVSISDVLYVYGSSSNFVVNNPTVSLEIILETDFSLVTISTEKLSSANITYLEEQVDLTTKDGYFYGYINSLKSPYFLNVMNTDFLSGTDSISNPMSYTHYNYSLYYQNSGSMAISISLIQDFLLEDRTLTIESLQIGDNFQGGKIFYFLKDGDNGYDPNRIKGLIISEDFQTSTNTGIGCYCIDIIGTSPDLGYGAENTRLWLNYDCNGISSIIDNYNVFNNDWFVPSIQELELFYQNLILSGKIPFPAIDKIWSSTQGPYGGCGESGGTYVINISSGETYPEYKAGFSDAGAFRLVRMFDIEANP